VGEAADERGGVEVLHHGDAEFGHGWFRKGSKIFLQGLAAIYRAAQLSELISDAPKVQRRKAERLMPLRPSEDGRYVRLASLAGRAEAQPLQYWGGATAAAHAINYSRGDFVRAGWFWGKTLQLI
jgi:hypothetical protein